MKEKTTLQFGVNQQAKAKGPEAFVEQTADYPTPLPHDLVVAVQGISVNPVDTKLREAAEKEEALTILGYDGVGIVEQVGSEVSRFKQGDRVYYAGTTKRPGSNQQVQLVDERIAAHAPRTLADKDAAGIPLTTLTAWELLFEKFGIVPEKGKNKGKKILVINGGGGVGSIMTQLAHWAGLDVWATSSPRNFDWLRRNLVDHPLDYHTDFAEQLGKKAIQFEYIAVLYPITDYLETINQLIRPFGHVGTIVGVTEPLAIGNWKNRSISFDWEYMFAKTDTDERIETQGAILARVATLFDQGMLHSTVTKSYDLITEEYLRLATKEVKEGHVQGKITLTGEFLSRREG